MNAWLAIGGAFVLGLLAGAYAHSRLQADKQTMHAILGEADRETEQRIALTARLADTIGAMFTEDCSHGNRKSCADCAERRTVQAAAAVVRETGGAQQRGESRDG